MAKLCQIIALAKGKKSRAQSVLTNVYQKLQKEGVLTGLSRTYRPKDEDGEQLPSETKLVQYTVERGLDEVQAAMAGLIDTVATMDAGNCSANGNIVVNGTTVASAVPVTTLLFLAHQLQDLRNIIEKLPTLDPAHEWEYNDAVDCYATVPIETVRNKKVPRAFEKAAATKEHPAQVDSYFEDVLAGYWSQSLFSGAIPQAEKKGMLQRVIELEEAVKSAREEANTLTITEKKIAGPLLQYVFRGE